MEQAYQCLCLSMPMGVSLQIEASVKAVIVKWTELFSQVFYQSVVNPEKAFPDRRDSMNKLRKFSVGFPEEQPDKNFQVGYRLFIPQ